MSEVAVGLLIVVVIVAVCLAQPQPEPGYVGRVQFVRECTKVDCYIIRTADYKIVVEDLHPNCVAGTRIVLSDRQDDGSVLYHCE